MFSYVSRSIKKYIQLTDNDFPAFFKKTAVVDLAKSCTTISYQQIVDYAIQTIVDTGEGRLFREVISMWTRELENTSCNDDIDLVCIK